jgi:YggT family protein
MLFNILDFVFQALNITLLVRVLLSWIPHNPYHPVIQYLYTITDPLLRPFQTIVPPSKLGGIDLSPMFAFIALGLLRKLIFALLI